MKIRDVVQLKDDIQKENLLGNTVEMVVTFQRKGIKANRPIRTVLLVAIIILENRARQKRSNVITERKLGASRNNAELG